MKKELNLVLTLEKKELEEFSELTKELIEEIERTKQELAIEERINLNLNFVRYKIKKIHGLVQDVLRKKRRAPITADEEIALIMHYLVELEKDFFPLLHKNLKKLASTESDVSGMIKNMSEEFSHYKGIVEKLRKALNVEHLPESDMEELVRQSTNLKAKIS